MKTKFKVGDRVITIGTYSPGHNNKRNLKGTVKLLYFYNDIISVEFDQFIEGHECGGETRYGYGWNVPQSQIKKIEFKEDKTQTHKLINTGKEFNIKQ